MLKTIVTLESIVEGKVGQFLLSHDTSVSVAKEMCFQFIKYLGQIEDNAKAKAEQDAKATSEAAKQEEPKAE